MIASTVSAVRRRQSGSIRGKIKEIAGDDGWAGLFSRGTAFAYRSTLRRLMPYVGHLNYSEVLIARKRRLFDRSLPFIYSLTCDIGDYEGTLIEQLRRHVRLGDRVVVVGGGYGVTVVHAARLAGPKGTVTCFEGAAAYANNVREAARINQVGARVTVHHAIVAEAISVYESAHSNTTVAPEELPDCDVLELDCEGAELQVVRKMAIRPRVMLIETHGVHGASTADVRLAMEGLGYSVRDAGVAEPRQADYCAMQDIRILVGLRCNP